MRGGFFGSLFDLNHDGELDSVERAIDFMAFEEMSEDEGDHDEDSDDDIILAGLDYDELSLMDEEERCDALEEVGLDLDDYDF